MEPVKLGQRLVSIKMGDDKTLCLSVRNLEEMVKSCDDKDWRESRLPTLADDVGQVSDMVSVCGLEVLDDLCESGMHLRERE